MNDIIKSMYPEMYYTPFIVWMEVTGEMTKYHLPFDNPKFIEQWTRKRKPTTCGDMKSRGNIIMLMPIITMNTLQWERPSQRWQPRKSM